MIVNHVGLCVGDIDASKRFYEALGFVEALTMDIPDEPLHRLVRLTPPIEMHVVYLTNGDFVLELLRFGAHPAEPVERPMTQPGLTHVSIGVDDLGTAKRLVADAGGEVLEDTDVGAAVMVRDPDGQLLELLDVRFRPVTPN